jgi:hypothetical protein
MSDWNSGELLPAASARGMPREPLIETVLTTVDAAGAANCAAIGVRWGERELVFWPFANTRTVRNLRVCGEAVVHLTDDVLLFVKAALGDPRPPMRPARAVRGWIIEQAYAWREAAVRAIAPAGDGRRFEVHAEVVAAGHGETQPLGLCRARHAVLEGSILASRAALIGPERVLEQLTGLQELVDKTGGENERAAMDYVRACVRRRVEAQQDSGNTGRAGARRQR